MKKILCIIGICVAIAGIATISYTNSDTTNTCSMSINDMKSVQGGVEYADFKCIYIPNTNCKSGCNNNTVSECQSGYSNHLCIATPQMQYTCTGSGSCPVEWWSQWGPCVSYPD